MVPAAVAGRALASHKAGLRLQPKLAIFASMKQLQGADVQRHWATPLHLTHKIDTVDALLPCCL